MPLSKEYVVALCFAVKILEWHYDYLYVTGLALCQTLMYSGNTKTYNGAERGRNGAIQVNVFWEDWHIATNQIGFVAFLNENVYRRQSKMPAKYVLGTPKKTQKLFDIPRILAPGFQIRKDPV